MSRAYTRTVYDSLDGSCGRCINAKVRPKVEGLGAYNLNPVYMAGWCVELSSPKFGKNVGRYEGCGAFVEDPGVEIVEA